MRGKSGIAQLTLTMHASGVLVPISLLASHSSPSTIDKFFDNLP